LPIEALWLFVSPDCDWLTFDAFTLLVAVAKVLDRAVPTSRCWLFSAPDGFDGCCSH